MKARVHTVVNKKKSKRRVPLRSCFNWAKNKKMESTQSSGNSTTVDNAMSSNNNSHNCLIPSVYFEIGTSTVPYTVNTVLNALLCIVATLANILGLLAIRKARSRHLPSRLLLGSLVFTDLGVSLVVQPLFVAFLVAKIKGFSAMRCFCLSTSGIAGYLLTCASLLTMTAQSLDRYFALFLLLRYREIVTTKRIVVALVMIWSLAGFFAFSWLWSAKLYSFLSGVIIFTTFPIISLLYVKIYRGLRHQHGNRVRDQAQAQPCAEHALNIARFKKSASSMLWIYCLFIVCYFPYVCIETVSRFVDDTVFLTCMREYSITVVYLNSCLNPFLYCIRIPEMRAGVLQTLRKFRCYSLE